MAYPRITFRKSSIQDFKTLGAFIKDAKYDYGRNLNWAVFDQYPQLKEYFESENHYKMKNEKVLRRFISEAYRLKKTSMNRALLQDKKRWEKISPDFFRLVETIFGNRQWPRGKYIAFGTIWGMYPRFLKDKTFQIPFWHRIPKYIPVVIAHELLHFMFYDYFYTHYPKFRYPKHNFFVWQVSEIFNTVVQNLPTWLSCFKLKSLGYPEHKKIVTRISRTLYRSNAFNLDALVEEIVKEVKKNKI
jgi:hypothetical protein